MAAIKGGRKRSDKGPGRNHWSPRKGVNAHKVISGQTNDSHGTWRQADSSFLDTKMVNYCGTMSHIRTRRNAENVSARRRRGSRNSKKPHTA